MHHMGGYHFLNLLLDKIKNICDNLIADENISRASVCINGDLLHEDYFNAIDADFYIDSSCLKRFYANADWMNNLGYGGIIFIGENRNVLNDMFEYATGCVPEPFTPALCRTDFDKKTAILNCVCIGYDGTNLVNLYDDTSLKEMLYHECMHSYSTILSSNKKQRFDGSSDIVKKVMRLKDKYPDDKLVDEYYKILEFIYEFSKQEYAAILAQAKVQFGELEMNSKKDFYDALKNSRASHIIKDANDVISFLDGVVSEDGMINELLAFYLQRNNETHATEWWIQHAIKKMHKDIDDLKHNLYNIAYDLCSDKLQNIIDKDF